MKKILIASAALAAIYSAPAVAADMAVKAAAPVMPVARCAAATWQGFYLGINGGGAYHNANTTNDLTSSRQSLETNSWGGAVGGQAGYNWAMGCSAVFGVEVDGDWLSNSRTIRTNPTDVIEIGTINSKVDAVVTARARSGLAFDSLLLYVTGGLAAVSTSNTWTHVHADASRNELIGINEWRWGWTAGFGAEYAWTGNWSVKSEVLFVGLSDRDNVLRSNVPNNLYATTRSDQIWISRVGLNYRFGGPVVAKY